MSCPVIELAQQLISRPSVSPDDQGCQQLIIERLAPLGFTIEKCLLVRPKIFGHVVVVRRNPRICRTYRCCASWR